MGALAQTMPMLTSGRRQATLSEMDHVVSGSVEAPAVRAVRTVQQIAVLGRLLVCLGFSSWVRRVDAHYTKAHEQA